MYSCRTTEGIYPLFNILFVIKNRIYSLRIDLCRWLYGCCKDVARICIRKISDFNVNYKSKNEDVFLIYPLNIDSFLFIPLS